jgi:hypothetical protein
VENPPASRTSVFKAHVNFDVSLFTFWMEAAVWIMWRFAGFKL